MNTKGTIIITDPCYFVRGYNYKALSIEEIEAKGLDLKEEYIKLKSNDWNKCDYGESLEELGFEKYVSFSDDDEYKCTVCSESKEELGTFTSKSGVIGAFELAELEKYDKDVLDKLSPENSVKIDDFDGSIDFGNEDFVLVGKGNLDFVVNCEYDAE